MQGEGVGVAVFSIKNSQSLNFAVAINEVKQALLGSPAVVPLPAYVDPASDAALDAELQHLTADKLFNLGVKAKYEGNAHRACRYFDGATVKSPNWSSAWLEAGDTYYSFHNYTQAVIRLRRAVALFPTKFKFQAALSLAPCEVHCGHFESAVRAYKALIRLYPTDVTNYYDAGLSYERLGWHKDAESMFARGRRLSGNGTKAWEILGYTWGSDNNLGFGFGQERWERAAEAYRKAIAIAKSRGLVPPPRLYLNLGAVYEQLHRWRDAVSAYHNGLRAGDLNAHCYYLDRVFKALLKLDDLEVANGLLKILDDPQADPATRLDKTVRETLHKEIFQYNAQHGMTKVRGLMCVMIDMSPAHLEEIAHLRVFADGRPLPHDAMGENADENVKAARERETWLSFFIFSQAISDGNHKVEVRLADKAGSEIAVVTMQLAIDNSGSTNTSGITDLFVEADVPEPELLRAEP
jgi:tetratricopeptide (TPR) repeat protein